jgi:hypothetical protein
LAPKLGWLDASDDAADNGFPAVADRGTAKDAAKRTAIVAKFRVTNSCTNLVKLARINTPPSKSGT